MDFTLSDFAPGDSVTVWAYGSGTGARLIDCRRTGEVTRIGRTRVYVRFPYGNGMPPEIRTIDPACLRRN